MSAMINQMTAAAIGASVLAFGATAVEAKTHKKPPKPVTMEVVQKIEPLELRGANATNAAQCVVDLGFPEVFNSKKETSGFSIKVKPGSNAGSFSVRIEGQGQPFSLFDHYSNDSGMIWTDNVHLTGASTLPRVDAVLKCAYNAVPKVPVTGQLVKPLTGATPAP